MSGGSPLRAEQAEQVLAVEGEQVAVAYDPDGGVWSVRASSVPGLVGEAESLDALVAVLPHLVRQARLP